MGFSGFITYEVGTDWLDMISGAGSGPTTEALWVGLATSEGLDENSSGLYDVSTGDKGYARGVVSWDAPASSGDDWTIANSSDIVFTPTTDWSTAMGLFVAATSTPSTDGIPQAIMIAPGSSIAWEGSTAAMLTLEAGSLTMRVNSTIPGTTEFGEPALTVSDFLAQKMLGRFSSGEAYSVSETWVALYSTLPDQAGAGGSEITAGGYNRVRVSSSGSGLEPRWGSAGTDNEATTDKQFWSVGVKLENAVGPCVWTFSATSGAGVLDGWGLWDASSGGNLLVTSQLLNATSGLDVTDYHRIRIPEGLLTIRLQTAPTSSPF